MYRLSVSFVLGWFGFLIALCTSATVAGRAGAVSGLGAAFVRFAAFTYVRWLLAGTGCCMCVVLIMLCSCVRSPSCATCL